MRHLSLLWPFVIVALAVALAIWARQRGSPGAGGNRGPMPFVPKTPFLEQKEIELLHRLRAALPDCHVFPQVQVSRVLAIKQGLSRKERTIWRNSIDRLSFDFVVCDQSFRPFAAVEVDGASHLRMEQMERDKKKDGFTEAAGIRVVRYSNAALPEIVAIKSRFASIRGGPSA